uniref:Uncharacterized protein n=1 Tax=Tanacetum cinerariifolium TaxID=118510 RepID=A0A6L2N188_TANCI|nr:hypothetical protein [Tanacetum cinerariifolium]
MARGGASRRHSTALGIKKADIIINKVGPKIPIVLQLLGTPTTHYYLNPEIPETYQILNTYKENPDTKPVIDIQRQWHQDRELEKPETEYDYVICSKLTQNTISASSIQVKHYTENQYIEAMVLLKVFDLRTISHR